jgi:hypothetical protein
MKWHAIPDKSPKENTLVWIWSKDFGPRPLLAEFRKQMFYGLMFDIDDNVENHPISNATYWKKASRPKPPLKCCWSKK